MASLKCITCGYGIHYHDEPDGTQYIAFSRDIWDQLEKTELPVSRYILDGTEDYYIIWRCKQCGSVYVFKNYEVNIDSFYKETAPENCEETESQEYIAYADKDWEQMTEIQERGNQIQILFPNIKPFICRCGKTTINIYDENNKRMACYQRIEREA